MLSIALSRLTAARTNPRRVKPECEAHRRLVASIRAYGLLEPLIVRPLDEGRHEVIAGVRRLAALRTVHRDDPHDPKVPCVLQRVDADTARAIGLSENFAREPMHPLDEAECFARLASVDCKGVSEIASDFGVSHAYIRQRMKLASLADRIKSAYRENRISTGTAEAFASVPTERQLEVWEEVGGMPRDAEQVRSIIQEQWIDAERALFDVAALPPSAVSGDLFTQRILIERGVFMQVQREALEVRRQAMLDEGWPEVVIAERSEVQERLYRMERAEPVYDQTTTARLAALAARREALEANSGDEPDENAFEALDREEEQLLTEAKVMYDDATKEVGTVFLVLDPGGQARTEYRVQRVLTGEGKGHAEPIIRTSEQLSERQCAALYTHEAIAVRASVAHDPLVCKRLVALALHDRIRHDGLSVSFGVNETTNATERQGELASQTHEAFITHRSRIDPFWDMQSVGEVEAYRALCSLSGEELDRLIEVLAVQALTGHTKRSTPFVSLLYSELHTDLREHWRPDAGWLAGYRKSQLAHLVGELRGHVYGSAALQRKKSELVEELAALFANSAAGKIDDAELMQRINRWRPSEWNVRMEAATVEIC